ncbi:hypothetical protein J6590_023664 [Homalodisca vitripennis]|nr:hypothetical protein J6590_023664 [Homalodisca vitripennis]
MAIRFLWKHEANAGDPTSFVFELQSFIRALLLLRVAHSVYCRITDSKVLLVALLQPPPFKSVTYPHHCSALARLFYLLTRYCHLEANLTPKRKLPGLVGEFKTWLSMRASVATPHIWRKKKNIPQVVPEFKLRSHVVDRDRMASFSPKPFSFGRERRRPIGADTWIDGMSMLVQSLLTVSCSLLDRELTYLKVLCVCPHSFDDSEYNPRLSMRGYCCNKGSNINNQKTIDCIRLNLANSTNRLLNLYRPLTFIPDDQTDKPGGNCVRECLHHLATLEASGGCYSFCNCCQLPFQLSIDCDRRVNLADNVSQPGTLWVPKVTHAPKCKHLLEYRFSRRMPSRRQWMFEIWRTYTLINVVLAAVLSYVQDVLAKTCPSVCMRGRPLVPPIRQFPLRVKGYFLEKVACSSRLHLPRHLLS